MPSTFRIPQGEITGAYGRTLAAFTRRMWGQIPDNAHVLIHHRPVLKAVLGFENKVRRWKALDPTLKTLAEMATAAQVGCSWCLDFGYFLAHTKGLEETKIREVPRWRDSDAFTDLEGAVMAYAEAMTATPPIVTDDQVAHLLDRLGTPAVVELTQMIALENMRSRFNSAAGLASQGFSDVCELPLAAVGSRP